MKSKGWLEDHLFIHVSIQQIFSESLLCAYAQEYSNENDMCGYSLMDLSLVGGADSIKVNE